MITCIPHLLKKLTLIDYLVNLSVNEKWKYIWVIHMSDYPINNYRVPYSGLTLNYSGIIFIKRLCQLYIPVRRTCTRIISPVYSPCTSRKPQRQEIWYTCKVIVWRKRSQNLISVCPLQFCYSFVLEYHSQITKLFFHSSNPTTLS